MATGSYPGAGDPAVAEGLHPLMNTVRALDDGGKRKMLPEELPATRVVLFAKVVAKKNESAATWTDFPTDGFIHHVTANPCDNSVGTTVDTGSTVYLLATPRQDAAAVGFADIAVNDIVAYITIPATVQVPSSDPAMYFTGQVIEHVGATGAYQRPKIMLAWIEIGSPTATAVEDANGNPVQWTYAAVEQAKPTTHGYGQMAALSGGWTGTAYNMAEDENDGTGRQPSNGVDHDGTDYPATFAMQPIQAGVKVLAELVTIGSTTSAYFSLPNGEDGSCE
jgi:hypothetical protein